MEWTPRRRSRAPKEETFNREGRWTRDFSSRLEPWPIIEHWASEHDYHLIAARAASRRVYQKDGFAGLTHTLVDIKVTDKHVTLTAGIPVSLKMRLFSFLLYPSELPVEPAGYVGVKRRREVCHELNSLLTRFGKTPIIGSGGFHVSDLDITTLFLVTLFGAPFLVFFLATIFGLEVTPGLSRELLVAMGQRLGILAGVASLLLGVHHMVVVKRFPLLAFRAGGAAASLIIFFVLSLWLTTQTRTSMTELKFAHHCFQRFSEPDCRKTLGTLSPRDREALRARLLLIEKSLSFK